jgi:hypothetical protein
VVDAIPYRMWWRWLRLHYHDPSASSHASDAHSDRCHADRGSHTSRWRFLVRTYFLWDHGYIYCAQRYLELCGRGAVSSSYDFAQSDRNYF